MERQISRGSARLKIKMIALSLVASAAIGLGVFERGRVERFIEQGRARVSQMMRLETLVWEEVGASNLSNRVSKEMLLSVSQLKLGQEMLPIDLDALEKRLLSVPWIESLQIQKKLPSTILVRYTVHQARAFGLRKGKLWLVSSGGKWIAPFSPDLSLDLPLLAREDSTELELSWLEALENGLGSLLVQVHEVSFSRDRSRSSALVELQYTSQSVKLMILGAGRPAPDSLDRLKRVVQYLIKNNILVATVDLRMGKKVVVNVGGSP